MIRMRSMLDVADNTGAKVVRCIKVLGLSNKQYAVLGDIVVASVRKTVPGSEIKMGDVVRGVIVRTVKEVSRPDGSHVKFDRNAIVLLDDQKNPRGTRIFGAVARELRQKNFMKILSLASEVV